MRGETIPVHIGDVTITFQSTPPMRGETAKPHNISMHTTIKGDKISTYEDTCEILRQYFTLPAQCNVVRKSY